MSDSEDEEPLRRRIRNGADSNLVPLVPCSFGATWRSGQSIPERSDSDSENHDQQPISEEVKRGGGIIVWKWDSPRSSGGYPSNLEEGDEEDVPNMENPQAEIAATNTSLVEDPVTTCDICCDHYTSSGDHRPCCLKCGHIYCKVCIEKWIDTHHRCPQCNAIAFIQDIRIVYVRNLVTMNTGDVDSMINNMDQHHREIQRRLERECWLQKQKLRVMKMEQQLQVEQCELQKYELQKLLLEEIQSLKKLLLFFVVLSLLLLMGYYIFYSNYEKLNEEYERLLEEQNNGIFDYVLSFFFGKCYYSNTNTITIKLN